MSPQLGSGKLPCKLDAGRNTVLIDSPDDVKALKNIGIVVLILVGVMMALIVTSVLIG
ncbi:MAG: hypothetical protein IIA75_01365 [Proteobacteria bacterium]|nr:hypothetical protein [Pseudomonadota bacterium]